MKRLLASLLALAMVLGVCMMAGCGGNTETTTNKPAETTTGNKPAETTTGGNATPGETTTAGGQPTETTTDSGVIEPVEWNGETQLEGYEDIDFGGRIFTIAGYKGDNDGFSNEKEIYLDEGSDKMDAVGIQVRERNRFIETLYGCKIAKNISDAPGDLVSADITTGKHTIDLVTLKYCVGRAATSGDYYNLADKLDLTQEWWDANYVKSNTIKNSNGTDTLYSIVGDFALASYNLAHAIMYNKNNYDTMVAKLGYDAYQLVRDGKWTMDIFAEMIKAGAQEVSGNSDIKYSEGDIVGWATTPHAPHGLHVASGLSMMSVVDGKLTYNLKDNVDQWNTALNKAIEVYGTTGHDACGYSNGQAGIVSGKVTFYSDIISKLEEDTFRNATDVKIGLLPYPKYSESQENYAHYVDNHLMIYALPISVSDYENVVDFLTILAAHSRAQVRQTWIDSYCYEYLGDQDSADMLEIILNTRTYDPGYLIFTGCEGDVSNIISSGQNQLNKMAESRFKKYTKDGGDFDLHVKNIDDNKA